MQVVQLGYGILMGIVYSMDGRDRKFFSFELCFFTPIILKKRCKSLESLSFLPFGFGVKQRLKSRLVGSCFGWFKDHIFYHVPPLKSLLSFHAWLAGSFPVHHKFESKILFSTNLIGYSMWCTNTLSCDDTYAYCNGRFMKQ